MQDTFIFIRKFDDAQQAIELATYAITNSDILHPLGGHYTCTRVFRELPGKKGYLVYCCHKGD